MTTGTVPAASTPRADTPRSFARILLIGLACLVPLIVTLTAEVRYTSIDPEGSLLVSEQLLTNQTIALDAYGPAVTEGNWRTFERDGHTYYNFPLGPSIASMPFVAVARLAGVDLPAQEDLLQIVVAALVNALIVLLMILLAELFVSTRTAVVLALAFWCGTMMASTGAAALWSHNYALLFGLLALYAVIVAARRPCRWCWPVIGISLVLAYLSRPTMLILIVLLAVYGLATARRTMVLALSVAAALMVPFVVMSVSTFGSVLPPYYQAGRLSVPDLWMPLLANVVSPGRGIVWFVPTILALPLLALATPSNLRRNRGLLILATAWVLLLMVAVARFPSWYGGFSFGPRLLTEALPAIFLLTVLLWPPQLRQRRAQVVVAIWFVLAVVGIWINVGKGLHDWYSFAWNTEPGIDEVTDIVWDWRYPQVLHDAVRHEERATDYGVVATFVPPA